MKYDDLTHEQLVGLLVKRDAQRRLGLVWERNEIAHDQALNGDFVVMNLDQEPGGSCGEGPWDNLVIEGDNFDALRWLRMTHAGQVRCILIDPPYNTGNKDFTYNDSYIGTDDRFRQSTWLEFLYRRLALARDLLTEDGVILVCINDDNRSKLELLMDEVFPGMRVGSFVWKTRSGSNDSGDHSFSVDHEHILVYAKPGFEFTGAAKDSRQYKNPDEDPRGAWKTGDLSKGHSWQDRPRAYYPIQNPETGIWYPCNPTRVWAFATEQPPEAWKLSLLKRRRNDDPDRQPKTRQPTMEEWIRQGKIVWPNPTTERVVVWETKEELLRAIAEGDVPTANRGRTPLLRADLPDLDSWIGRAVSFERPWFRRHLSDLRSATSLVSSWIRGVTEKTDLPDDMVAEVVTQRSGTSEDSVKEILGHQAFSFPKPPSLFRELLRYTTDPDDIVLDFFAGSGTTAHAVLALNAEDDGHRRFILVSSREATKDNPGRNLCRDVCAERVRRVIEGYSDVAGLGGDFAYVEAQRIEFGDLAYDLRPEQVWLALQAAHGMSLSPFRKGADLQLASNGESAVAYCDRFTEGAERDLGDAAARHHFLVVYAYAPRPVRDAVKGCNNTEVRALPDYLVRRFQG